MKGMTAIMKKKGLILCFCLCTLLMLCACKDKDSNISTDLYVPPVSDNVTVSDEQTTVDPLQPSAESLPLQDITLPSVPVIPTTAAPTEQATEEENDPAAAYGHTNEYTASGMPLKIYTISEFGTYTGEYEEYYYDYSDRVLSVTVYRETDDAADVLVAKTSYTYDGRGNLTETTVQKANADGTLYTERKTRSSNDFSGRALEVTDTMYSATGDTIYTQTVKNSYDDRGMQILQETYVDSVLNERTETAYTYNGSVLAGKTETTVYNPDTANEHTSAVITTYNAAGLPATVDSQDENGTLRTEYTYDEYDRESEIRIYDRQGNVSQYIVKTYTDYGAGSVRLTEQYFTSDGNMFDSTETYYDPYGTVIIP